MCKHPHPTQGTHVRKGAEEGVDPAAWGEGQLWRRASSRGAEKAKGKHQPGTHVNTVSTSPGHWGLKADLPLLSGSSELFFMMDPNAS